MIPNTPWAIGYVLCWYESQIKVSIFSEWVAFKKMKKKDER